MFEITGSREHGQNITGWQDGRTQARVWWKGTDDDPRSPEAHWTEYQAVTTGERQTLVLIGMIREYVNLELGLRRPGAPGQCRHAPGVITCWRPATRSPGALAAAVPSCVTSWSARPASTRRWKVIRTSLTRP